MIKKLRHVGIAVDDIDKVIKKFEAFGLPTTEMIEKEEMGQKIAFAPLGDTLIEFISFVDPNKGWDPMHMVTRNYPGVINHLCFEVDDIDATIKDFEKAGARLIEGCPKPGGHGVVAYFYPETTENVLIELCQV